MAIIHLVRQVSLFDTSLDTKIWCVSRGRPLRRGREARVPRGVSRRRLSQKGKNNTRTESRLYRLYNTGTIWYTRRYPEYTARGTAVRSTAVHQGLSTGYIHPGRLHQLVVLTRYIVRPFLRTTGDRITENASLTCES